MTDRIQALRLEGMKRFGFGPDVMKQTKVCRVCGGTADAPIQPLLLKTIKRCYRWTFAR